LVTVILHVDLDSFFAQAELIRNPSLKGKPVVICVYSGRGEDGGAVSTASYEARKYHVESGMPITQAKRLLKNANAEFIKVDMPYYRQLSYQVMHRLEEFADRFEQVSIDEAYLDVTRKVGGSFENVESFCLRIKQTLRAEFGLSCSIGVGTTKCTSKIASGHRKPDGLTIIEPLHTKEFLAPLPIRKLPGIGPKTEKALNRMGIRTLGELAQSEEDMLARLFGRKMASYFRLAATGEYYEGVKRREDVNQIGRMATLKEDSRDFSRVWSSLEALVVDVHQKMQGRKLACRACAVALITKRRDIHSRSHTYEHPVQSADALKMSAQTLLKRLIDDVHDDFRRVGFRVSNLSEAAGQSRLFEFEAS